MNRGSWGALAPALSRQNGREDPLRPRRRGHLPHKRGGGEYGCYDWVYEYDC